MSTTFPETPIFDRVFAEAAPEQQRLVLVAIADKPHVRTPDLLDGFAQAMDELWCASKPITPLQAMERLIARAFPESQTAGLPDGGQTECTCAMTEGSLMTCQRHGMDGWAACDGCGRSDDVLTESLTGVLHCGDCRGDTAYDSNGDRR